jgi:hypothetical protein
MGAVATLTPQLSVTTLWMPIWTRLRRVRNVLSSASPHGRKATGVLQGLDHIVDRVALTENTWYWWRRAVDSHGMAGDWATAGFL